LKAGATAEKRKLTPQEKLAAKVKKMMESTAAADKAKERSRFNRDEEDHRSAEARRKEKEAGLRRMRRKAEERDRSKGGAEGMIADFFDKG